MTTAPGFAIRRNGSCLPGIEVDCGPTLAPFRGCCPNGLQCPQAYNIDCCPRGQNCTLELLAAPKPRCANATWDLYTNGGYFCCESGLPGYNKGNTNVCASPGSSGNGVLLALVAGGEDVVSSLVVQSSASSTGVSSLASSLSLASALTTPTSSSPTAAASSILPAAGSSTPVGAIAGGVVGGVAGLALLALIGWLVMRRKRRSKAEASYLAGQRAQMYDNGGGPAVHQLDDSQRVYEAGAGKVTYGHVGELPGNLAPVELSAEQGR